MMTIHPEIIWVLIGIFFIFFEIFIPNFVIAFFGGGALLTALATWIGITTSLISQLLIFIISSLLLLILFRKYLKRIFTGRIQGENGSKRFDVEIGKIVPVTETIKPESIEGKIRYQGSDWLANASETIPKGENAKIIGRDNLTIIVEKIKKED